MAERKEIPHRYMMATTAIHKLGDISSNTPDLCDIYAEKGDDYIGQWVEGFGFFDVKFPKSTTRELTQEEKNLMDGKVIAINGTPQYVIRTKGDQTRELIPAHS